MEYNLFGLFFFFFPTIAIHQVSRIEPPSGPLLAPPALCLTRRAYIIAFASIDFAALRVRVVFMQRSCKYIR